MVLEDKIVQKYLQAAHDRGGSYAMAMSMMAQRLVALEDRLQRAGMPIEPDRTMARQSYGET